LTEREIEVLEGVKEGLPDREIAIRMTVSHSTVKAHIRNILTKLDARSRTQAVSKYFGYF
jgi:DNA-binding NarL/FixJ family response regulator